MSRRGPLQKNSVQLWPSLCNAPCVCVLPKIPHYSPSVCYQYQPFASPRHYYPEQEQRRMSPPLEVSDGEDDVHKLSSFRKDTSEWQLDSDNQMKEHV